MIRLLFPIVLIYISQGAYAFDNSADLQGDSARRDFAAISDLFPTREELACVPRCEGPSKICGEHKTESGCVDDGAADGCYWLCE